ncbi:hypothetical protein ACMBCN_02965, partial [Candidatus Liberibacter asiaticus]|nr:hypothetical protein [Candidatus Liberibacter asiaticus]
RNQNPNPIHKLHSAIVAYPNPSYHRHYCLYLPWLLPLLKSFAHIFSLLILFIYYYYYYYYYYYCCLKQNKKKQKQRKKCIFLSNYRVNSFQLFQPRQLKELLTKL